MQLALLPLQRQQTCVGLPQCGQIFQDRKPAECTLLELIVPYPPVQSCEVLERFELPLGFAQLVIELCLYLETVGRYYLPALTGTAQPGKQHIGKACIYLE